MSIKHAKVSGKPDGADATLVRPSDWNASHVLSDEYVLTDATAKTYLANTWYTIGADFPNSNWGAYFATVYVQYDDALHHQKVGSCVISLVYWKADGAQVATTFAMEQHTGADLTGSLRPLTGENSNRHLQVSFSADVVVTSPGFVKILLKRFGGPVNP